MDQFLTYKDANLGPVFNFTAYAYIYIYIYIFVYIYTYRVFGWIRNFSGKFSWIRNPLSS